ncbi:hypothetical protein J116_020535 [Streptomyces thermolilacinus SPC6]|uniref:Uncharacterized protein n=2 Tax=Streptomyces thermolilacinus TaxID=285540 RepID=A0A1D3DVY6_9ACTN|nr:hypothetical protein J116_020535 [Streptomyces thermolilacinus SPC6]
MDWKEKKELGKAIAQGVQKAERERQREASTGGGGGGTGNSGGGGCGECGLGGLMALDVIVFLIHWPVF